MDNPIIAALRRARQAYMTNVGEPTAQLMGGGVRGYLGLDAPEYADSRGMEAYRNAAAIGNTPVVGMPSMAVRAGTKAAPAMARALREQAQGFQEYNRALGPAGASQAIVWHGSPHKFDRFDSSKIGTGEGAQAYGHGIYTAEARDIADQYRINLSYDPEKMKVGGRQINQVYSQIENAAARMPPAKAQAEYEKLDLLERLMMNSNVADVRSAATEMSPATKAWFENTVMPSFKTYGYLYKVDLPDEKIARMLDWDKPLYRQAPNVRKAVRQVVDESTAPGIYAQWVRQTRPDMRNLQNDMLENMSNAEIAEALRKQGIPGIRYLDQGSRGAGQGTSNFVVFPGEEAALTILERNNEIINALRKRKPD